MFLFRHPGESRDPDFQPAETRKVWVPAFAGMTVLWENSHSLLSSDGMRGKMCESDSRVCGDDRLIAELDGADINWRAINWRVGGVVIAALAAISQVSPFIRSRYRMPTSCDRWSKRQAGFHRLRRCHCRRTKVHGCLHPRQIYHWHRWPCDHSLTRTWSF